MFVQRRGNDFFIGWARIEAPKASRGRGNGEAVYPLGASIPPTAMTQPSIPPPPPPPFPLPPLSLFPSTSLPFL